MPNNMPVKSVIPKVKSNTRKSGFTSSGNGVDPELTIRKSRRSAHSESSNPNAPPRPASSKLSVNNWRNSRPRPAPSAHAHRKFPLAAGSPRQLQVRHVGASEQQDKPDQHHQRHQRLFIFAAQHRKTVTRIARHNFLVQQIVLFVGIGKRSGFGVQHLLESNIDGSLSLFEANARFQASHDLQKHDLGHRTGLPGKEILARINRFFHRKWKIYVGCLADHHSREFRRHYADHIKRGLPDAQFAADYGGILLHPPLPECVADHRYGMRATSLIHFV